MTDSTVWVALFLSLFAGLSTCIGGAVVFFSNLKNTRFLALSMSFAAGVMIYVSFMEMLPEAQLVLGDLYGNYSGVSIMVGLFFLGMLLVFCIEKLFPSLSEIKDTETEKLPNKSRLYRTGVLVAIALAIHNFPEGIATFIGGVNDLSVGLMIAFAIALHNIPEGIAVAAPIYYSTGNKWKAFRYSLYSGIAEPIGAFVAFLLLGDLMTEQIFSFTLAIIAGIMVYISFDYLLPGSWKYGNKKDTINGTIVGMAVMAISLLLFD